MTAPSLTAPLTAEEEAEMARLAALTDYDLPIKPKRKAAKPTRKVWAARHPERARELRRNSYHRHAETINSKRREKRKEDPETVRERRRRWEAENRDELNAKRRAYYAANRERMQERERASRAKRRVVVKAEKRELQAAIQKVVEEGDNLCGLLFEVQMGDRQIEDGYSLPWRAAAHALAAFLK